MTRAAPVVSPGAMAGAAPVFMAMAGAASGTMAGAAAGPVWSVNDPHRPLPKGSVIVVKKKRKTTSRAWDSVKELTMKTEAARLMRADEFTHVCVYPLGSLADNLFCNTGIKSAMYKGTFNTTAACRHLVDEHEDSDVAVEYRKRAKDAADIKVGVSLAAGDVKAPPLTSLMMKRMTMTHAQERLTAQAQWYVYSNQQISKRSFDDIYFKKMMKVQAGDDKVP